MKKKRFTLIELFVVLSIIMILAGLLLPALNISRKVAKKSSCKSNMKQISSAFLIYADDFNGNMVAGRMPSISGFSNLYDVGNGFKFRPRWYAQIGTTSKCYAFSSPSPDPAQDNMQRLDNKLFICPQEDLDTGLFRDNGRNYSYGYNFQFLGNSRRKISSPNQGHINWPRKMASISTFSGTIVFADGLGTAAGKQKSERKPYDNIVQGGLGNPDFSIGNHAWSLDPPRLIVGSSDFCNDSTRNPASRSAPYECHIGIANFAFLDGHVESGKAENYGYEKSENGSFTINGNNKFFSGTGADDAPPDVN